MISGPDKKLRQRLQGCTGSVDDIRLQNTYEKLENLTIESLITYEEKT